MPSRHVAELDGSGDPSYGPLQDHARLIVARNLSLERLTTTENSMSQSLEPTRRHWSNYPRFLLRVVIMATDGTLLFYTWMTLLTAFFLVGVNAWAYQVSSGMITTQMSDHVSWGLYIANFTFIVGLAAGGVMMVIPAYLYHDEEMHDVVLVGELLAIAAIVMCMLFVVVDLGRPDRFWHLIPGIGRFNWPISMLTWDVIVLNIYLVINLGAHALVPWMWTSVICNFLAALAFLNPHVLEHKTWLVVGCVLAFVGIWIEKGMGLFEAGTSGGRWPASR
jgi:hypothetical protein